jgi:zinc transport system permease protein
MIMAAVTLKARHRADTIIGVIWALGMACGIILIDLTPRLQRGPHELPVRQHPDRAGYRPVDHGRYGAFHRGPGGVYYKDLLALSYDEEFARIRGVP